jgi:hypothetical protein
MPRLSKERRFEVAKLMPLIDALNGEGEYAVSRASARRESAQMHKIALRAGIPSSGRRADEVRRTLQKLKTETGADVPQVEVFVEAGNVLRQNLRSWVDRWIGGGPKPFAKFLEVHADVNREMNHVFNELRSRSGSSGDLEVFSRLLLTPAEYQIRFEFEDPVLQARSEAVQLFINLTRSRIAVGKCALPRCGRYFLNIGGQRRKECCKRQHTGAWIVERRRQKTYEDALARATRSIKQWQRARRSRDWKSWVAKKAKVTKNFLTARVSKGDLKPPKGEAR